MNEFDLFRQEMSPALTLIDVSGRRHRIASLDEAALAIRTADELQALGGAKRIARFGGGSPAAVHEAQAFLLYYTSHSLQASSREIARAARILARSEAVGIDARGNEIKVTGSRALAYADRANPTEGRVCFLVSQLVWYNENRAMLFPATYVNNDHQQPGAVTQRFHEKARDEHLNAFLEDVNRRLEEGSVSFPR